MTRRVLMIAFHFPPQQGSSGIQRTLKFVRYLPHFSWHPEVLTAHPRAYGACTDGQMQEIPADVTVHRAFALDTSRHLAFRRRYLGAMALPDRWVSWLFGAIPSGWRSIRRWRPHLIWSTYPIATAHLIGLLLHRLSGLPWIADMRDPMTEPGFPAQPTVWRAYRWIEQATAKHCTCMVFTTPGALQLFQRRYPQLPPSRFRLIENGYDEDNFAAAEQACAGQPRPRGVPLRLLHSGIIYPSERDPIPLFDALATLKARGAIDAATVRIVLRATWHDDYLQALLAARGLQDMVELAPPLPYHEALVEMLSADGLLVLQAANCNDQIPAKLYEYFRAGKPILALTDAAGNTAAAMRRAGLDTIAPLDSCPLIAAALSDFIARIGAGNAPLVTREHAQSHSRQARTGQLAALFDEVLAGAAPAAPATSG